MSQAARSTPPPISVRTRIAGTGVGRPGGISAPTAIPMGGAGANCCASSVAATFWRPSAQSFTGSGHRLTSSYGSSAAWPKAWASGARRRSSRSIPIRSCSGWSRPPTKCEPFRTISCTICSSARCNWTNSTPCSMPSKRAKSARMRRSSACSAPRTGSGSPWSPRVNCSWRSMSVSGP